MLENESKEIVILPHAKSYRASGLRKKKKACTFL
jgi:hypothetical protein